MTRKTAMEIQKKSKYNTVAYRCRFCGWWHMGYSDGRTENRKKLSKLRPDSDKRLERARG